MERTTLDALSWQLSKGEQVAPVDAAAPHRTHIIIRRRFQFSSALKRMSTVSTLPNGRCLVATKGAPETIRRMLAVVPSYYDDTYKWYTRRGSRVLALGCKETDHMSVDAVSRTVNNRASLPQLNCSFFFFQINKLPREQVESGLQFCGFLVFHCPLKEDAVETLKMLGDSSHRVSFPRPQ